jgi:FkbM family methyltransferase
MEYNVTTVREHPPAWVRLAGSLIRRMPVGRYRFMNALPRPAAPFVASLASVRGMRFTCHLGDGIAREACYTGQYEPGETLLLQRLLAPGATFIDVGANWGYFTLVAAGLVGPTGRVASWEPDPRMFALLDGNVRLNGLANVTALQAAASDAEGTLGLVGFDAAQGNWGVSRLAGGGDAKAAETFQVRTRPIDVVLDELGVGAVDLLKMDIEGAEAAALRGMAAGIAARRYKAILLELHPTILARDGVSATAAIAPLVAAGYRARRIDHSAAGIRRAAYGRLGSVEDILSPIEDFSTLDEWPHILWTAPGSRVA